MRHWGTTFCEFSPPPETATELELIDTDLTTQQQLSRQ